MPKSIYQGALDAGANESNLWGYVTDLAFDYLDWLDQSKGFNIHVNWGKTDKFQLKHGMKFQDRCKLDSKLNPKDYELSEIQIRKLVDQLIISINPNLN